VLFRSGNIVEFQIEKNAGTQRRHFADRSGTCRGEQLVADFEHADKVGYLFGELDRRIQRIKIEGDDQAASRMGVEGQSYLAPAWLKPDDGNHQWRFNAVQAAASIRAGPG
jgi:hypothetical protein